MPTEAGWTRVDPASDRPDRFPEEAKQQLRLTLSCSPTVSSTVRDLRHRGGVGASEQASESRKAVRLKVLGSEGPGEAGDRTRLVRIAVWRTSRAEIREACLVGSQGAGVV